MSTRRFDRSDPDPSALEFGSVTDAVEGLLHGLGLTEVEEQIYLHVFQSPYQTGGEVANATGLDERLARDGLTSLEKSALIARTADQTPRFFPTPPATALEALALAKKREIERDLARVTASMMAFYKAANGPGDSSRS